jgi:hypothetical protein
MLIDQLGRTLRAIGDAHGVRGETKMAKVLVDGLSAEIAALHDQFETSSTRDLVRGERGPKDRAVAAMDEILQRKSGHHRARGPSKGRGIER